MEQHGDLLHDLAEGDQLDRAPAAIAKLIAHVLQGTQPPFWGGHHVAKIVPELRPNADHAHVRTVVEEALRLGVTGAASW